MHDHQDVTELLRAADGGDPEAFQRLYQQTYQELRRLARQVRQSNPQTLNTTALVHEAYLKLAPGQAAGARDRVHFFRIAGRAMRQVLIDAARRRAVRRDRAELVRAELAASDADRITAEVLDLENALTELESLSPRQASVVECRFFAGLSVEETAVTLGVSAPTIKREWRVARAWLADALEAGPRRADAPASH